MSFIEPEIISLDEKQLKSFINESEELKTYSHYISDILREKEHILSQREEEILALVSEIAEAPSEIFSMLNNADIKFPTIKDEKGEEVELTKGRYIRFLESNDRRVRKDAYEKLISIYGFRILLRLRYLIIYVRSVSLPNWKYNSSLEASLSQDNVSTMLNNLIKTVHETTLFYRYMV